MQTTWILLPVMKVFCQNSDKCGEILKERTEMGKGWVYGPLIGSNDQRTNFDQLWF